MIDVDALLRSNDELRAALILAGKEIRKLNFGKADNPVLVKMREVLRRARVVARDAEQARPRRFQRAHPETKSLIDQVREREATVREGRSRE